MSAWLSSGGYGPIAEKVFALHADRLLPEYDTERAGTVGPLRIVPEVKIVVLDLVSKRPELELRDQLRRRLDAGRGICSQGAARPQCTMRFCFGCWRQSHQWR